MPQSDKIHAQSKALPLMPIEMFREKLDQYMEGYFDCQTMAAAEQSASYAQLWKHLHGLYTAGGKRIRPYLAYVSYYIFGGEEIADVIPLATAIELLHMAMLAHDDIIDRDDTRHGQPNLIGTYRQIYAQEEPDKEMRDHYATSASILGGDILISEAYRLLSTIHASSPQRATISSLFSQSIFEVIGGELLDTEAVLYPLEAADPYAIGLLKTASYTCTLPLKTGAVLAGAPEDALPILSAIGADVGTAFQMADDEIGVFGNETETGKSINSDLCEAKRTLLLQLTYKLVTAEQRDALDAAVGNRQATDAQLAVARNLINASGALARHQAQRKKLITRALRQIDQLPAIRPTAPLYELASRMAERRS